MSRWIPVVLITVALVTYCLTTKEVTTGALIISGSLGFAMAEAISSAVRRGK